MASTKHPEIRPGEVFITNARMTDFCETIGWKTKRNGEKAYDIHGNQVGIYPHFFPVFAQKSEVDAAGLISDENGNFVRSSYTPAVGADIPADQVICAFRHVENLNPIATSGPDRTNRYSAAVVHTEIFAKAADPMIDHQI